MLKMLNMLKIKILARENKTYLNLFYFRDRPFNLFNLQGGGGGGGVDGFLLRSKHFFRTTRVRILIFFVAQGANFFSPEFNIRLYDKNSESDYYQRGIQEE